MRLGVKFLLDVIAGVMVLSEVAERLMMLSGLDASTCPAECGQAAASLFTEVVATTVPAGHRRLGGPSQEQSIADQTVFCWPHSNEVPSTQIQWRITAIFRAMATFAFLNAHLATPREQEIGVELVTSSDLGDRCPLPEGSSSTIRRFSSRVQDRRLRSPDAKLPPLPTNIRDSVL